MTLRKITFAVLAIGFFYPALLCMLRMGMRPAIMPSVTTHDGGQSPLALS